MTRKEKEAALYDYCENRMDCVNCPAFPLSANTRCDFEDLSDQIVDRIYAAVFPENDVVNHPTHYCREGAIECFDEMLLVFGKRVVADFCLCNAWKYRYRAADKNGVEDLKKSDWYMAKYRELTDSVEDVFK